MFLMTTLAQRLKREHPLCFLLMQGHRKQYEIERVSLKNLTGLIDQSLDHQALKHSWMNDPPVKCVRFS